MEFFAYIQRQPDGLYRATFHDLPELDIAAFQIHEMDAAVGAALHERGQPSMPALPMPTNLQQLAEYYDCEAGIWAVFVAKEAPLIRKCNMARFIEGVLREAGY